MPEFSPGTIVDGRYKIVSRLGSGGMADVYLADDQQLGRQVALKLLYRRFAEDPGFVERFRREAQAAAGLQHPNVVSIYDRGAYDDTYYISMEYLQGRSLKQLIRQESPLEPVRAIEITVQILKAARFAHRRGVIHRDLKPHNVIVDEGDHAKVTDFGIARAGASDMTETGSIMGTAQYLSPEQAQGRAVSGTSDLYSIGVVLYEMLTGRVPFDAESAVSIALKHVAEAPPAPSAVNPSIPHDLEQLVLWSLNKNPGDRPHDADEFITTLEHVKGDVIAGRRGERTTSIAALAVVGAPGEIAADVPVVPPPFPTTAAAVTGSTGAITATGAPIGAPTGAATGPGATGESTAAPIIVAENGHGTTSSPHVLPPPRRRRVWPWLLVLLVLLLLGGGGAAAYLLTRPAKATVPGVVGETLAAATARLNADHLKVAVTRRPEAQPSGTVTSQSPRAGKRVRKGMIVALTVSTGPAIVYEYVPPVTGEPAAIAKANIQESHLTVGRTVTQTSPTVPSGEAIRTNPAQGRSVPAGTRVTLFVSSGQPAPPPPPTRAVPDVSGLSQSAAIARLRSRGFDNITTSTQLSKTVTAGNVINQSPGAGASVPTTTPIQLVLAKAPATSTIPPVTGENEARAAVTLTQDGFNYVRRTKRVTNPAEQGIVLSQSPAAGRPAPKGSTVTIVVGRYVPPHTSTTTSTTTTSTTSTTTTTTPTTGTTGP